MKSAYRWSPAELRLQAEVEYALQQAKVGRWEEATKQYRAILSGTMDTSLVDRLADVVVGLVDAAANLNQRAEVAEFAEHNWQSLPVPAELQMLAQATALVHLGRWETAARVLAEGWVNYAPGSRAYTIAERLRDLVNVATGRRLDAFRVGEHPSAERVQHKAELLCRLSEAATAGRLLNTHGMTEAALSKADAVLFAFQSGHWDRALQLARALHVNLATQANPVPASVYHSAIVICTARGRIGLGRQWLARATEAGISENDSQLRIANAGIAIELGRHDAARRILQDVMRSGESSTLTTGLVEMLGLLLRIAVMTKHPGDARSVLDLLAETHARTGSRAAELLLLSGRVVTDNDIDAVRLGQCVALERGNPLRPLSSAGERVRLRRTAPTWR